MILKLQANLKIMLVSKIYKKCIMKIILEIEGWSKIDITGNSQHGFKKKNSTAIAGLVLQLLIVEHLDEDDIVMMASLDLSAAFDIVYVEFLLNRLTILGLPDDILNSLKSG